MSAPKGVERPKRGRSTNVARQAAAAATDTTVYSNGGVQVSPPRASPPTHPRQECLSQVHLCALWQIANPGQIEVADFSGGYVVHTLLGS